MVIPEENDERYTPWTDYGAHFVGANAALFVEEVYSDNLVTGHQVQVEAVTLLIDVPIFVIFEIFIQYNLAELHAAYSGFLLGDGYFIDNLGILLINDIHIGARATWAAPIAFFTMEIAGKQRSLRKQ